MLRVALVVDDSMLIRHTVCRFLEQRGFTVETATNGAEAIEVLPSLQPALILTDLMMPKVSGSELITAIKANPATANIPVVVLSARSSAEQVHPEGRAEYVIYKDIDIEIQLERALTAVTAVSRGR